MVTTKGGARQDAPQFPQFRQVTNAEIESGAFWENDPVVAEQKLRDYSDFLQTGRRAVTPMPAMPQYEDQATPDPEPDVPTMAEKLRAIRDIIVSPTASRTASAPAKPESGTESHADGLPGRKVPSAPIPVHETAQVSGTSRTAEPRADRATAERSATKWSEANGLPKHRPDRPSQTPIGRRLRTLLQAADRENTTLAEANLRHPSVAGVPFEAVQRLHESRTGRQGQSSEDRNDHPSAQG